VTDQVGFDVVGLGQCCIDYLGRIADYPPPDAKCEFDDLTVDGGGPVSTALVALARWGMRCAFLGVVGDDWMGGEIRRVLESERVDTGGLLVRPDAESQFAFIVSEPTTGRRTVFWRRPTGAALRPGDVPVDLIQRSRVVHTDGLFAEASIAAARTARDAGSQVSVDAGSLRDGMLELAALSHHFIASATFATAFAPDSSPLEVCRRLAEMGPEVVAVTLGSRGYVAMVDGAEIEGDAYAVDAVDTTGCGDVFHAGYVYGVLRGWDVARRLDFGSWAASRVALYLGGRRGIPAAADFSDGSLSSVQGSAFKVHG
jgi:ribokinase